MLAETFLPVIMMKRGLLDGWGERVGKGEPGRERERKGGGGKDKPLLLSPACPRAHSHPGKKVKEARLESPCVRDGSGPST